MSLWTADERFYKAASQGVSNVRFLGDPDNSPAGEDGAPNVD